VSSFGFSGSIAHTRLSGAEDLSDEDVRALVPVAETLPPYPTKYRFELVCSTKPTCCGQVHVPADAAAEPEPEKPIKTYEVVWGRESLATPPEDTRDAWDYGNDKVLIVGGGLDGVLSGGALTRRHIDFELFELEGFLGGVWVTMANLTSKVQTGKLTYTLDLEDQSPHVADESNFQPADEVVKSITGFALRMGIDKKTSIFREVTSVTYEPWPSKDCGVDWTDWSKAAREAAPGRGLQKSSVFQGVIFACGSLRSPTLAPMAPAHYGGYDSYGVCGDMRPCEMAGRDLVIAGHGAYGVENVRTGLEHGAKAITLVCRHRHSVLPRCAVWLLDAGRAFDAWDEISKMLAVAKMAPAYTTDRRKRPAVSDQYYAATRFGRACIVHGKIHGYDADASNPCLLVETPQASGLTKVRADVALLCYGFSKETSIVNRTMGVFEEGDLTGIWVKGQRRECILRADLDVRKEATPLSASNIPFASFLANTFCHFLTRPKSEFDGVLKKLPKAGNSQDTTSFDFFASTFLALVGDKAVQPQLTKIIRRVQHVSVNDVCAWTDFVEDCAGDWRKYVGAVGVPGREEPYGDWLGRSPSPHPDGLGQRKEASRALTADGPLASPAAHHVSVLVFDDAAAKVGADAWTAVSTPGRTPGVLVLAFPRDVLDLAVGTLYAAEAKVPHTVVLLKDRSLNAFHAQLRVARVEEPRLKLSSAVLRCGSGAAQLEELCEAPAAKDCVLTSNSGVLVPSLVETASSTADERSELRGAWAVTGGTGALGLVSAALLMDLQGDVVIATRSPRIKVFDKDALVTRVGRLRKRAHLVAGVDTSGSLAGLNEAVSAVFSSSALTFGGVVHAAGVLHDTLLSKVERWMVDKVTGPKASNLGFLRGLVDDVVHFTSATVILGGPGQTAYAHSSGALDDDALGSRGGGRRSSALQWLAIEGVGMHQEAVGTAPQWTPLERMERILRSAVGGDLCPSLSVLPEAFLSFVPKQLHLKDDPSKKPQPEKKKKEKKEKKPKEKKVKKEKAPKADVGPVVEAALKQTIENIMEKYDPANDEVPFMEMGVDSMGLTDFVNQLNSALGIELPEVALFEYPTVSDLRKALITMVLELQGGGDDSDSDDESDDEPASGLALAAPERSPLLLSSITGKLSVGDVGANALGFYATLRGGCSGMGRLPLDRVHSSLTSTGLEGLDLPHTATYGGFIQTKHWIDFDGDFFGVAVAEAKVMDPQQRQLMEVGFEALDAAGITKQAIRAHDDAWTVGNFVALQTNDFARAIVRSPRLMQSTYAVSGANPAIAAGRLPYALGLRGAAFTVDTACSTALVCLHEARLADATTDRHEPALVSAVNAMIDASVTEVVERAGMLSPRGRCHTFDGRADGYARGEGVVAVLIRRQEALDGVADVALHGGVLLPATSLRSDGRTASITAPSAVAQRELLALALDQAPKLTLTNVETHGTGTALGDPIEMAALASHAEKPAKLAAPIVLSGVKAYLGHLEPAAGFAGVAALLGAAKTRALPPNPLLRTLNGQLVNATKKALSIPAAEASATPCFDAGDAVVGVGSFGFSGIVAHARFARGGAAAPEAADDVTYFDVEKRTLYRGRVSYPWLEVVEPLVYGIDAHADAAPDAVGARAAPAAAAPGAAAQFDAAGVKAEVRRIVGELSGADLADGVDASFDDAGVDSIAATELSRALKRAFKVAISPTFLFDYPTVDLAADAIVALLADRGDDGGGGDAADVEASSLLVAFGPRRPTQRGALFLWSGGQGDSAIFAQLGREIAPHLRVYGVDRRDGAAVGDMARDMAPLIAAAVPDNDAACFVGGLSVGGWLAVETALRLAPLGKRAAAVFALDGPEPSQFDLDCSYAPAEGAAELLLGRNRTFPEGWAAMTADQRVDAFLALLPSLGIHFLGYDAAKSEAENKATVAHHLTAGADAFISTLRTSTTSVYDKATSKLDADLVLFRASERRAVKMLKDGDADAAPHLYAWASAGVPNVTVVDCPSNHMHMLLDKPKIDAIRATVLDFVDMSNRK